MELNNINATKPTVGEQNLGPCGGLRYNVSPTIRPRRGNHRETS